MLRYTLDCEAIILGGGCPFLGLMLAGLVLGEPVAWTMIASTAIVILCVVGAKRFA